MVVDGRRVDKFLNGNLRVNVVMNGDRDNQDQTVQNITQLIEMAKLSLVRLLGRLGAVLVK